MIIEPVYNYDEESDTLSIVFAPAAKATGIELTDHILLRINKTAEQIASITLLDYSLLVQETAFGPRTFPLTGLAELSEETRDLALDILRESSVRNILRIAAYTPKDGQIIPVVFVQPVMAAASTA
ncbi:DUF2283 domain-containing protein [Oscillochloris sp. ZM17-4]|uniref:DUF2283 domain-containing protein n=1 Tax=Oscillochloris sp. ZM17-4 TaxID=2866714 RepID=UPI001C72EA75|nr:DUF2283 domain-containing protein [Oscillochloris sp. ZM17-4]MBX0331598.1 DUF2283 domain-containing protein [Oscillochloris sp. ZM17-4]